MYDITEAKRLADAACKVLIAIAEGYPVRGVDDCLIVVENPDHQPDDGSDPNLVIDAVLVAASLRDAVAEIERLRELARQVELFSSDAWLGQKARALVGDAHGLD